MGAFTDRTGEKGINNQGIHMVVIDYKGCRDMTVKFEDGFVVEKVTYSNFSRGLVPNPNYKSSQVIDRTGEAIMHKASGQIMTIISYRNTKDIDVQFEDGTIVRHKSYDSFKKGIFRYHEDFSKRLGEQNVNNQGFGMKIIRYGSAHDIDIEFEDGYIVYNKLYKLFKEGAVLHPKYSRALAQLKVKSKVGDEVINSQGLHMKVIAYRTYRDIDVQFEDGYIAYNKCYEAFKFRRLQNPNYDMFGNLKNPGWIKVGCIFEDSNKFLVRVLSLDSYDCELQYQDGLRIIRSYKVVSGLKFCRSVGGDLKFCSFCYCKPCYKLNNVWYFTCTDKRGEVRILSVPEMLKEEGITPVF